MGTIDDAIKELHTNPAGVRSAKLAGICEEFFGKSRQFGTSHKVFKMPWPGDPRVNIQEGKGGKAKVYQVKQVIQALERLKLEARR